MDIEFELEEIVSELNGVHNFFESAILNAIDLTLKTAISQGKFALVCAGKHTSILKRDFKSWLSDCDIIDKNTDQVNNHIEKIYKYENVFDYKTLIISSYEYRDDVKSKLNEMGYNGNIVDIYDELKKYNILLTREYYHYKKDPYSLLIIARGLYQAEKNREKKAEILLSIISMFANNKDILQLKRNLKEYLYQNYPQKDKYQLILEKIISLENYIFNSLQARKQRDIICFWQDDLRYSISKELPYLNQCREKGIDFTHAYSASWSTRSTYGCMMERSSELSLFLYSRKGNQISDLLSENGYKSYRIGGKAECEKLETYDYKNAVLSNYEVSTTELLWEALKILINEEKPVFILIHSLLESHMPFYAPTLENYKFDYQLDAFRLKSEDNLKTFEENALHSARYLDEEMEYMGFLLPDSSVKIYMSDHGCILNRDSRVYKEEMSHIPFIVVGNGIPHIVENRLFSLKKFYEVINYILSQQDYENICDEYLDINGTDLYSETSIQWAIDIGIAEMLLQYIGIRTLRDMYIYRATGEECYYILPNEKDNVIDNINYSKRIEYLKSITKKEMIDINKIEKFKYSHRLYDSLGKAVCLI